MSRSSPRPPGLRRWLHRDRRGIAAMEFGLVAPVMAVMLLCTADIVLWLRTWLRMEAAASEMAQIISQYPALYTSDFTGTFFPIAQASAGDSVLTCSTGSMVVTGITNPNGTPNVAWQWASGSCASSRYAPKSDQGYSLSLPDGYVPPNGFSAILIELSTTRPNTTFSSGIMNPSIASFGITVPRTTALPTLTAGNRPSS